MTAQLLSMPELTVERLELFFLVLVRVSVLVFMLPFLHSRQVPRMVQVGIAFFISLAVFARVDTTSFPFTPDPFAFFTIVMEEVYIGIVLGFASMFLFAGVTMSGDILNREMGLGRITGMDPVTEERSVGVSLFLVLLFSVIFLVSNGHYFFVKAIADSFDVVPVGQVVLNNSPVADLFIKMTGVVFVVGLKIASPVLTLLLVTVLAMAFVSRIMPQMNVWFVMLPVKIVTGILTMIFLLPLMYNVFERSFSLLQTDMLLLMKLGAQSG